MSLVSKELFIKELNISKEIFGKDKLCRGDINNREAKMEIFKNFESSQF